MTPSGRRYAGRGTNAPLPAAARRIGGELGRLGIAEFVNKKLVRVLG
jgi:hypothetical protein